VDYNELLRTILHGDVKDHDLQNILFDLLTVNLPV